MPLTAINYDALCQSIAADVEELGKTYPQLRSFDATKASTRSDSRCTVDYDYHTHPPTGRGGWSSSVPNPDPDGLWLHIRLWDPTDKSETTAQINTQPVMPSWWIGERRVTYLILEGERTNPCSGAVFAVLERHGLLSR